MAYEPTINVGDFIEINFESSKPPTDSTKVVRAKVLAIFGNGPVPEIEHDVVGTHEDPAVKVQIYTEEKDAWSPTPMITAYKMSELRRTLVGSRSH